MHGSRIVAFRRPLWSGTSVTADDTSQNGETYYYLQMSTICACVRYLLRYAGVAENHRHVLSVTLYADTSVDFFTRLRVHFGAFECASNRSGSNCDNFSASATCHPLLQLNMPYTQHLNHFSARKLLLHTSVKFLSIVFATFQGCVVRSHPLCADLQSDDGLLMFKNCAKYDQRQPVQPSTLFAGCIITLPMFFMRHCSRQI